jgi:hypothetical protein
MVAYEDNWTTDRIVSSSGVKSRVFAVASNWVARCLWAALLIAAARLVVGAGAFVFFVAVAFLRSFVIPEHSLEPANAPIARNHYLTTKAWITNWRCQAQRDGQHSARTVCFAFGVQDKVPTPSRANVRATEVRGNRTRVLC